MESNNSIKKYKEKNTINKESISDFLSSEHFNQWPKIGQSINTLISMQHLSILLDSEFIKSKSFFLLLNALKQESSFKSQGHVFFVFDFDFRDLNDEEKQILNSVPYRLLLGDNYDSCFKRISHQGICIAFLATNGEKGTIVQSFARKNGIYLRWYGLDALGNLRSLYAKKQQSSNKDTNIKSSKFTPLFRITNEIVKIQRSSNPVYVVPKQGSRVFSSHGVLSLQLEKPVMTDHFSITYFTDNVRYYAKIYTLQSLQIDVWENKANRMLKENVEIPGVCWPIDTLKDSEGKFVGILTPASNGVQLSRSVLNGKTGLSQLFPQWDKRNLCRLTENILKTICELHEIGVYFGCINPSSIYISSDKEIYFVDTDAWQIEGYPATSKNQTFTPPELLRNNSSPYLYSVDQEYYQIALLTFMLMMPGKFPYAKRKGTNERESIINMSFPFSIGGGMRRSGDSERPSGIWRIVWDHLSYKLCYNFYNSFHPDGKYSLPNKRLKDKDWLQAVKEYYASLESQDRKDSICIFPKTFRHDEKRSFERCSICGQEHPDFYFVHSIRVQKEKIDIWKRGYRICLPCADDKSDVSFSCNCCGRTFFYTNRTKIVHEIGRVDFDWVNQRWCRDCKKRTVKCKQCGRDVPLYQIKDFEDRIRHLKKSVCTECFKSLIEQARYEKERWKNEVYTTRVCNNRYCGRTFTITNGEYEYYNRKGLNLPTRCPNCRKKRF